MVQDHPVLYSGKQIHIVYFGIFSALNAMSIMTTFFYYLYIHGFSVSATGTIKILLTRPVRRWKVLMSKLITLSLFISLIIFMTVLLSYAISALVFGYGGWTMPVLAGFQLLGSELNTANAHVIDQWLYLLMEVSLCWFSCFVVGCLSLMISVLVRSTAAGMGIMLGNLDFRSDFVERGFYLGERQIFIYG